MGGFERASKRPWAIRWKDRFQAMRGAPGKQDAADEATEAWWLAIEETEGWVEPPPPLPPQPPDPHKLMLQEHRERRFRQMLAMGLAELSDHYFAFKDAASGDGPSIEGDRELDRESWSAAQGTCVQRFGRANADYDFRNVRHLVVNIGGKTLRIGDHVLLEVDIVSFNTERGFVDYGLPARLHVRGDLELFAGQKLVVGGTGQLIGRVTDIEPREGALTIDGVGPLAMPIPLRSIRSIGERGDEGET